MKNLIYACVFHQKNYINLLELLIRSISLNANINNKTTDILILTSSDFLQEIQEKIFKFNLPLLYYILDLSSMFEASCCKLNIFDYTNICLYNKILYLDTDVLINNNINYLFDCEISNDKLYALEEEYIGHENHGAWFFDFNKYDKCNPAFSAGVFYFMNSPEIKLLFDETRKHIKTHIGENKPIPPCLDQPFLVYNSFIQNKYDNQMLKKYIELNPDKINKNIIIYHFPGIPGWYSNKYDKMAIFMTKMENPLIQTDYTYHYWIKENHNFQFFETRKEMIKYYSCKFLFPKILEIGVFKGEFLKYIVDNCKNCSIDGIDLFNGMSCSGDENGNDVVYFDTSVSYTELNEIYRNNKSVKLYKSDSNIYLQSINDNLYDIIYIDAHYSYQGVKTNLINSIGKIKNKGYIMGHDYEMNMSKTNNVYDFGVKRAVDEFCVEFNQTIISKAMDGCVSYCIQIIKDNIQ